DGVVPVPRDADRAAAESEALTSGLPTRIDDALADFDLRSAAAAVNDAVAAANRYVEDTAPWALARAERAGADTEALDVALAVLAAACRAIVRELRPFLPPLASTLDARLNGPRVTAGDPPVPRLEPTKPLR